MSELQTRLSRVRSERETGHLYVLYSLAVSHERPVITPWIAAREHLGNPEWATEELSTMSGGLFDSARRHVPNRGAFSYLPAAERAHLVENSTHAREHSHIPETTRPISFSLVVFAISVTTFVLLMLPAVVGIAAALATTVALGLMHRGEPSTGDKLPTGTVRPRKNWDTARWTPSTVMPRAQAAVPVAIGRWSTWLKHLAALLGRPAGISAPASADLVRLRANFALLIS